MSKLCLLSVFAISTLLFSCKKEQPSLHSLEEDCDCAKEVSGEFLMEEIYAYGFNWERRTETIDTTYGDKNVSFYAKEDDAEYTWYIGAEVLHTREVIRYFPNSMNGQTIPITLVTKKKANLICFPNDDGYDSIIHYLTIVKLDTDNEFRLEGNYKVKSPLLTDSTIITISKNITPDYIYFNVYNYDGIGSNCVNSFDVGEMALNYRDLYLPIGATSNSNGKGLHGSFIINSDNSVVFDLITGDYVNGIFQNSLYNWKYKGRKL